MTELIVTTPAELRAIVRDEVGRAMQTAANKRMLNATELAAELGVSTATVARMEKRLELPPRTGRYWDRGDIERWRKSRH